MPLRRDDYQYPGVIHYNRAIYGQVAPYSYVGASLHIIRYRKCIINKSWSSRNIIDTIQIPGCRQ